MNSTFDFLSNYMYILYLWLIYDAYCKIGKNKPIEKFGLKNIQIVVLNFCESGIALKSYGQFPDYPIAFESIPNVPVRGFTYYC